MRGNTISIKGNITRDAEVRQAKSGRNVAQWGVCWNATRKAQDGSYEDVPHFFDVKCWVSDGQLRAIEPSLVKGATCAIVDGHLEMERWQDKDGNNRSKVMIVVDDPINGLHLSQRQAGTSSNRKAPDVVDDQQGIYDEDIPF